MQHLDDVQTWHAVRAVASRKLQLWISEDRARREHCGEYFDHIVSVAWILAQSGDWMSEEDFLSHWPEHFARPHVMTLDDIERTMAYASIAETDSKHGWSKYRWSETPASVRNAACDFRFSESYSEGVPGVSSFRSLVMADLFFPFPQQYGLRGDAYLWGKLSAHFSSWDMDADCQIEQLFGEAFQAITGKNLNRTREDFFDEGLAHGGMSSGSVSVDWWQREGLPLLVQRFQTIQAALPVSLECPYGEKDGAS